MNLTLIEPRTVLPCPWCLGRHTAAELQRHLNECHVLAARRDRRVATGVRREN